MSAEAEAPARETVIDGLFVQSFGPEGGRPILLSAGLGGSGAYWQPQIAALAHAHRVVCYDHRGTGRSDRGALPSGYSARHLAADMLAVLDGLAISSAHVVGHAAGGIAGLQLAYDAPERVRTLTVVNGWAAADPYFVRCIDIRREIMRASGPSAYLKAQPLFLYPASWISEHLAELDAELAAHAAAFQTSDILFARMEALQAFDIRADAARVAVPTLLVVANDDMLVPSSASEALAAAMPYATIERLSWGGHAVNVTAPATFNAILLHFLAGQHG